MKGISTLHWKNSLIALSLVVAVAGPLAVFSGTDTIYVDKDNKKGKQDGSRNHPYDSIGRGLRHAKGDTVVYVAKGTYKENVTIPKDVKLIGGKKKEDVIIRGDSKEPTVSMKDHTEINKITVEGGRHGIRVLEDARAKVIETVVKDSVRDGIHIDKGTLLKKDEVFINEAVIKSNRMAGIFSERRNLIVTNTDINKNGDGVDLTADVKAWFADNRIMENRGSGFKITLDGASFWSKNNSVRRNGREGLELNSYGVAGAIGFKKAQFIDNGRYGIAKIARSAKSNFQGLSLDTVRLEGNKLGSQSSVLRVQ